MKNVTTMMERIIHNITFQFESVIMEVLPKSVLHTSPERLEDVLNIFIRRYPSASAPTEIMAMAASPFILAFCPALKITIALITVIGRITYILMEPSPRTAAIAIPPKATCDKPSPINESLLSTSVTPKSEEQSAISTPTIKAFCTNGLDKYNAKTESVSFMSFTSFHIYFTKI